jgi:copper transport protein
MVFVVVGASAGPAVAHANLVSSQPPAGANVPQAPGAVVLHFSEPLNQALSTIEVSGPAGSIATAGPTEVLPGEPSAMRRPLGLLRPGVYAVHWSAVSSDDGHTEEGSYAFAVGTAVGAAQDLRATLLSTEGPFTVVGHFMALLGLALWAGIIVLRGPAERGGVPSRRVVALVTVAPALALAGSALAAASLVDLPSVSRSVAALADGRVGVLRIVVLGASAVGVAAHNRWRLYGAIGVVSLVAEVASGHVTATSSPFLSTAVLAVHFGAVGVWIAAIALALLSPRVVATLRILSPYAVAAGAAVVATGIVSTAFEVTAPGELVRSGYGLIIVAKVSAVALVAGFGAWHWRARRAGRSTRGVRVPLRLEATFAGVALLLATVLVGSAPPSGAHDGASARHVARGALVASDELSVANSSGPFVVAFTISPARPGPVQARVQVLGPTTTDRIHRVVLDGTSPTGATFTVALRATRPETFVGAARIDAAGYWTLSASLSTDQGLVRVAVTVPLPARGAGAELDRAINAQQHLISARVHETLRSAEGRPVVVADYRFHAPDGFGFSTNGSDEVAIGARSYRRDAPTQPWTLTDTGFPFRWPAPYFRQFWGPGVAAHIIGSDDVDGVPSRIVAFMRPDLPAWFRIWVGDTDGLVRREEMLAEGHLMEHTYSDFDRVPAIAPPL